MKPTPEYLTDDEFLALAGLRRGSYQCLTEVTPGRGLEREWYFKIDVLGRSTLLSPTGAERGLDMRARVGRGFVGQNLLTTLAVSRWLLASTDLQRVKRIACRN